MDLNSLETLNVALDDGVATVTLTRPESRNAINSAMREELGALVRYILNEQSIRAVVLTGAAIPFAQAAICWAWKVLILQSCGSV
jgi:enoyl-CoA hydratase/carnithine racemase